jgi:transcriptional regulator with XRE-family HTH domain
MNQKLTADDDLLAERRQRVAALRLMHYTQREIAAELGVSVATVNRDLAVVRAEWAERRSQSYESWVGEELAKLDLIERAILPAAISGDDKAQARLVQFMDRRARMMGLDKPERHEHTVITLDAVEAEIARLEREMAERERSDA